jgi:hypothetical protein
VAADVRREHGAARVITAANCFAHIEDVHAIVEGILDLLAPEGVFISESHYLIGLMERLQYDTIYHEHLRYYSLTSLAHLLQMHGLEVFHARAIPTHGGSIRVYAARRGMRPARDTVASMLAGEPRGESMLARLKTFRREVMLSKLRLLSTLRASAASARPPAPARWSITSGSTRRSSITSARSRARSRSASTCRGLRSRWLRKAACSPISPTVR